MMVTDLIDGIEAMLVSDGYHLREHRRCESDLSDDNVMVKLYTDYTHHYATVRTQEDVWHYEKEGEHHDKK